MQVLVAMLRKDHRNRAASHVKAGVSGRMTAESTIAEATLPFITTRKIVAHMWGVTLEVVRSTYPDGCRSFSLWLDVSIWRRKEG